METIDKLSAVHHAHVGIDFNDYYYTDADSEELSAADDDEDTQAQSDFF